METVTHSYLTKLRIIAKIPENGKLDTTQNDLNIYDATFWNWVWRKFQGDSKAIAVKYLTDLYREITSFSDQLMHNINTESNILRKNKKLVMLVSLTEKIKESLVGVRNLSGTYKNFLKTVSLLECVEQDIVIPQYRILKAFIPENYHTDVIKAPLTYSHNQISAGIVNTYDRSIPEGSPANTPQNIPQTPPQFDIDQQSIDNRIDASDQLSAEHHSAENDYANGSPSALSPPIEVPQSGHRSGKSKKKKHKN
jgi:hypothetical protein